MLMKSLLKCSDKLLTVNHSNFTPKGVTPTPLKPLMHTTHRSLKELTLLYLVSKFHIKWTISYTAYATHADLLDSERFYQYGPYVKF